MKRTLKKILISLTLIIFITSSEARAIDNIEFKGVWLVTVYNIDWDQSNPKGVYVEDLDLIKAMGLNTVVFQVRPMGDAFYKSQYAPWSKYISGKLGENPGYDPLNFAIDEAHKRNLKFHGWFNPFRISADSDFDLNKYIDELPEKSPLKANPQWIVKYMGNHKVYHWINPGEPEARHYIIKIVKEVMENYNIDGIHIDDYFYPYKIDGVDFPDEETFKTYGEEYSTKDQWRRDNINKFVKDLSQEIKTINEKVEFGISPFGIWKSGAVEGKQDVKVTSSYDDLYCDTAKFIDEGWIDYVVPQIYWDFNNEDTPYERVAKWWEEKSKDKKIKLYIGHGTYKDFSEGEIERQIIYNKSSHVIRGSCFYNMSSLRANKNNVQQQIKEQFSEDNNKVLVKEHEDDIQSKKEESNKCEKLILLGSSTLFVVAVIVIGIKIRKNKIHTPNM